MKTLLPGFILILTLIGVSPAFAIDAVSPSPLTTRETMKDARTTYKADMVKAREDFKTKLKAIKDVKKQTIVERIGTRLPEINTTSTTHMSEALNRLSTILEHAVTSVATITPAPTFDTSLVSTARAKIVTAQQAVQAQAAKDYVITLGTDATLKPSVLAALTALKTDLQTTNQSVIAARTATLAALKAIEAAKTPEGDQ